MKSSPPLQIRTEKELEAALGFFDLQRIFHEADNLQEALEVAYYLTKLCKVYKKMIPPDLSFIIQDPVGAYQVYMVRTYDAKRIAL